MGVGCRLWRLPSSWFLNDWREVAEVVVTLGDGSSLLWCGGKKEFNRTGWFMYSPGIAVGFLLSWKPYVGRSW